MQQRPISHTIKLSHARIVSSKLDIGTSQPAWHSHNPLMSNLRNIGQRNPQQAGSWTQRDYLKFAKCAWTKCFVFLLFHCNNTKCSLNAIFGDLKDIKQIIANFSSDIDFTWCRCSFNIEQNVVYTTRRQYPHISFWIHYYYYYYIINTSLELSVG